MNSRSIEISVVLVRTIYDSNIGAASRAMGNMGFSRLILIDPKCEITYAAQQAAATGQTALQKRSVYKSWQEFHATETDGIRISMTARDGRGRQVEDLHQTISQLTKNDGRFSKAASLPVSIYFIFGPEDWGLSAEDLELSHFCCSIPTYSENPSLNLAQAVLLTLFIARQTWGTERSILDGEIRHRQIQNQQNIFPEESLKTWLLEMGFDLSKPKINAYSVLRKMLLKR